MYDAKDSCMKIAQNSVVSIHYTLKNSDGDVLDSSVGDEPLNYLHGAGNIVPGLENALVEKKEGDQLDVVVKPDEGYGEYNEQLVQNVPRSSFEGVEKIEVGARFQAESNNGPVSVVVTTVDDESVVVDGNHPLAGQTLHFAVTIEKIREASEEELSHGHVH